MATQGVENVAELGATGTFRGEINASGNNKLSIISASGTQAEGTRTFDIDVTSGYPLVTLLSMIGPSPDWFVGISGLSLLDGNGDWRTERVVNLYPYDAGTEEGTEFTLNNSATNPQEPISSIRCMGKFSNHPMARLTFTLKTTPPPPPPPPPATAPGKPPTPVVTPGNTQLTVRWSPPSDDGGAAISSYDLRHSPADAGNWTEVDMVWQTGGGELWHTIRSLTNGTAYDVQVRAINSVDEGPWSDTARGTPVDPNPRPSPPPSPPAPVIAFSPSDLSFDAAMIGDAPASQKLQVWNSRTSAMRFGVSDNADWLTVDPQSGSSNGPNDLDEIDVSVDTSTLEAGYHRATIQISGSGIDNSPQSVPVVLTVGVSSYATGEVSGDETTVVAAGDSAVRLVVPQGAVTTGATAVAAELAVVPSGSPPEVSPMIMLSANAKTYPPDSDTPDPTEYPSGVELWLSLPADDPQACSEGRTKVYSATAESWELVEHRCETDEEDRTYAVSSLLSVSTLVLVVDMDYDANGDGRIDRDEVITAIIDYFAGRIDRDRVLRIIQRYFSSQ